MQNTSVGLPAHVVRSRRIRRVLWSFACVLIAIPVLDWAFLRESRRATWLRNLPPPMLQTVGKLFPDDAPVLYAMGYQRAEQGDAPGAEPLLRRATVLAPSLWTAKATYANVLVDLKQENEAFFMAQECLMDGPPAQEVAPAMVASGRMHLHRGEAEEARQDSDRALAAAPESADAWLLRAEVLEVAGAWPEMRKAAEHVTRARPRQPAAWTLVATAALRAGDAAGSAAAARNALALGATDYAAQRCLGEALLAEGRVQDHPAIESALAESLRLAPNDAQTHVALGELRLRQSRLADAKSELEAALHAQPELNRARFLLARVATAAGDAAESGIWQKEANQWESWFTQERQLRAKMDGEHYKSKSRFALARLYIQMGLWKNARREIIFGLQAGPDSEGLALRKQYRAHAAQVLKRTGKNLEKI